MYRGNPSRLIRQLVVMPITVLQVDLEARLADPSPRSLLLVGFLVDHTTPAKIRPATKAR